MKQDKEMKKWYIKTLTQINERFKEEKEDREFKKLKEQNEKRFFDFKIPLHIKIGYSLIGLTLIIFICYFGYTLFNEWEETRICEKIHGETCEYFKCLSQIQEKKPMAKLLTLNNYLLCKEIEALEKMESAE